MKYQTTYEWLKNELLFPYQIDIGNFEVIIRDNRVLSFDAGIKKDGYILAIYKSEKEYCVHSFYEYDGWLETEPPMFGYFNIDLEWNDLLIQIANKYDSMINSLIK